MRKTYFEGMKLYPGRMLNHHLQGLVACLLILGSSTSYMVLGVTWTVLYISYQGLSMVRKKDSAGLDVMDYMVGFLGGLVAFLGIMGISSIY